MKAVPLGRPLLLWMCISHILGMKHFSVAQYCFLVTWLTSIWTQTAFEICEGACDCIDPSSVNSLLVSTHSSWSLLSSSWERRRQQQSKDPHTHTPQPQKEAWSIGPEVPPACMYILENQTEEPGPTSWEPKLTGLGRGKAAATVGENIC